MTLDEYQVKPKVELFPMKGGVFMYALHDDYDKPGSFKEAIPYLWNVKNCNQLRDN